MPPEISATHHLEGLFGTLDNDNFAIVLKVRDTFVDFRFQWDSLTATDTMIGGNNHLRAERNESIIQRAGGKTGEDGVVDRSDPETGKNSDDALNHVGKKNGNCTAVTDAKALEHIGAALDVVKEHAIGSKGRLPAFRFPNECNSVAAPTCNMTIEQIDTGIHHAAAKEFKMRQRSVLNGIPSANPLEFGSNLLPEFIGILLGEPQVLKKCFGTSHSSLLRSIWKQWLLRNVGHWRYPCSSPSR